MISRTGCSPTTAASYPNPIGIIRLAAMDPDRKRKIRLVVALGAAVLLAAGLVYTSFSASSETRQPSELAGVSGGSYDLTGKVAEGSVVHDGAELRFEVADREDPAATIPVVYTGTVPDPFREGREVIVSGTVERGHLRGREGHPDHQVPVEVRRRGGRGPRARGDRVAAAPWSSSEQPA